MNSLRLNNENTDKLVQQVHLLPLHPLRRPRIPILPNTLPLELGLLALAVLGIISYILQVSLSNLSAQRAWTAQALPAQTELDTLSRPADSHQAIRQLPFRYAALPPRLLTIPRLYLAGVPIVEGDDLRSLTHGVGHQINSAWPGQKGTMVLSGHNDVYGQVFRNLEHLQPGDEVLVSTGHHIYRYRVTGKRVVSPDDMSVIRPTSTASLALITCTPLFFDTNRLIVFAQFVN